MHDLKTLVPKYFNSSRVIHVAEPLGSSVYATETSWNKKEFNFK